MDRFTLGESLNVTLTSLLCQWCYRTNLMHMATSDRLSPASHPAKMVYRATEAFLATRACFALIGAHQCCVLMEGRMTSYYCIHLSCTWVNSVDSVLNQMKITTREEMLKRRESWHQLAAEPRTTNALTRGLSSPSQPTRLGQFAPSLLIRAQYWVDKW